VSDARVGAVFAALGDDTRRSIWRAVVEGGPVTATALAGQVPVTRQAVSKHLRVLDQAGLVTADRVGRETRYAAPQGSLQAASEWIAAADAAWSDRLARLKARAEGSG
jgi:DNA-binding transcriptional ArsR family regulator